jgi:hypothetical protein
LSVRFSAYGIENKKRSSERKTRITSRDKPEKKTIETVGASSLHWQLTVKNELLKEIVKVCSRSLLLEDRRIELTGLPDHRHYSQAGLQNKWHGSVDLLFSRTRTPTRREFDVGLS